MDKTHIPSQENDATKTDRWDIDARWRGINRLLNLCIFVTMVNSVLLLLVAFLLGQAFCPNGPIP